MVTAFQSTAFQNNAFQISGVTPVIIVDTHDGATIKHHHALLKKQAKLAEQAIYRNAPKLKKPTLEIDLPQETKTAIAAAINPEQVAMLLEEIRFRKILEDDEEAITWLMQ